MKFNPGFLFFNLFVEVVRRVLDAFIPVKKEK